MRRVDSLEKTLILGGTGGRRRRGWPRMRWLDGITDRWTWVWVNSGRWWWTGRPGVLWFMGSQRVEHDWATELKWTELSAYKLNKQGDNIQPWHIRFLIWNQCVVPCPFLMVASWPAYRFLRRQVRWSGIPISFRIFQFVVIHTVKGFGIVSKAEVDVFLELSCFLHDPTDVGNLIQFFRLF